MGQGQIPSTRAANGHPHPREYRRRVLRSMRRMSPSRQRKSPGSVPLCAPSVLWYWKVLCTMSGRVGCGVTASTISCARCRKNVCPAIGMRLSNYS
jgi:hypothetical protein